jgi:CHASE3 domain sensor protein
LTTKMRRRILIGSTVLLLMMAVAAMALVVRGYKSGKDRVQLSYTNTIKKYDIVDAARNALFSLSDAEIREENYVLTGETVYSEAYAGDIRTWQEEFASLELVAKNDAAAPLVQDLSKAGTRTLNELAAVVSLYEKSGRDAALERIRKGSGTVYLDQARNIVAMILEVDARGAFGATQIVTRAALSARSIAKYAALLFALTVADTLLLILEMRRAR